METRHRMSIQQPLIINRAIPLFSVFLWWCEMIHCGHEEPSEVNGVHITIQLMLHRLPGAYVLFVQ